MSTARTWGPPLQALGVAVVCTNVTVTSLLKCASGPPGKPRHRASCLGLPANFLGIIPHKFPPNSAPAGSFTMVYHACYPRHLHTLSGQHQ